MTNDALDLVRPTLQEVHDMPNRIGGVVSRIIQGVAICAAVISVWELPRLLVYLGIH